MDRGQVLQPVVVAGPLQNAVPIEAVVEGEVYTRHFKLRIEGRGRGRGRGEVRGRGRGAAQPSADIISTAATIASDETPTAWPDTTVDETVVDPDPKDSVVNGIYNDTPAFEWSTEVDVTPATNGTSVKSPSV